MNIDREQHVVGVKLIQKNLLVEELQVDERYQRSPIPAQIKWITNHYDEVAFGRVLVAQRTATRNELGVEDVTYWIIDGQQRWSAAKRLGMKKIPCLVFESLGLQHEAEVFKLINANRRGVRALEVFKAQLAAEDPESMEIDKTIRELGFVIGLGGGGVKDKNIIQSVASVKQIYKLGGVALLNKVFGIVKSVWSNESAGIHGLITGGLAVFIHRLDGQYKEKRLKEKLKKIKPETLLRYVDDYRKLIGGGGSKSARLAVAEAICLFYNKGAKGNRLEVRTSQVEKLEEDDA